MNPIPPPLAVRIAATVCIVLGSGSLAGVLLGLFLGGFSLDFGFLGIPIGRGLLMGGQWARRCASALCAVLMVVFVCWFGWEVYSGRFAAPWSWDYSANFTVASESLLAFATVFFTLRTKSARDWFGADAATRATAAGWTLPLVIVGMCFSTMLVLRDSIVEKALGGFFQIETEFRFFDAQTGKPLKSIGHYGPLDLLNGKDPFAPRYASAWTASEDSMSCTLKGLSGRPVDITFTSPGYKPVNYTLKPSSPAQVDLAFEPE